MSCMYVYVHVMCSTCTGSMYECMSCQCGVFHVSMCTITTLQRALPKHGTRNAELARRSAKACASSMSRPLDCGYCRLLLLLFGRRASPTCALCIQQKEENNGLVKSDKDGRSCPMNTLHMYQV